MVKKNSFVNTINIFLIIILVVIIIYCLYNTFKIKESYINSNRSASDLESELQSIITRFGNQFYNLIFGSYHNTPHIDYTTTYNDYDSIQEEIDGNPIISRKTMINQNQCLDNNAIKFYQQLMGEYEDGDDTVENTKDLINLYIQTLNILKNKYIDESDPENIIMKTPAQWFDIYYLNKLLYIFSININDLYNVPFTDTTNKAITDWTIDDFNNNPNTFLSLCSSFFDSSDIKNDLTTGMGIGSTDEKSYCTFINSIQPSDTVLINSSISNKIDSFKQIIIQSGRSLKLDNETEQPVIYYLLWIDIVPRISEFKQYTIAECPKN